MSQVDNELESARANLEHMMRQDHLYNEKQFGRANRECNSLKDKRNQLKNLSILISTSDSENENIQEQLDQIEPSWRAIKVDIIKAIEAMAQLRTNR